MNDDLDLELALAKMRILVAPDRREAYKGDRPLHEGPPAGRFSESAWATLHAELTAGDDPDYYDDEQEHS